MKYQVLSALLGASKAVSIKEKLYLSQLDRQCEKMSSMCNVSELSQMDTYNLIQMGDNGVGSHVDNTVEEAQKHYGKTTAEINAQNKKILDTQKTCLDFVAEHPEHPEVCKWCSDNHEPTDPFQWNPTEGVWYKWANGKYQYWGPSKEGLKHNWSWYDGYWHHGGYVFKYENGKWYRFQGGQWVVYGEKIDIDPIPPRTKECRNLLLLEQAHIPDSLTEHELPRCQVGDGAQKDLYQWTNEQDCTFLGGKKVHQKNFECKDGSTEQFREVEICIQGDKISGQGFDYITGQKKLLGLCGEIWEHPNQTGRQIKHCLEPSDPFWYSPSIYKSGYNEWFNDKASSATVGTDVGMVVYEHTVHNSAWRQVLWPGKHNLSKDNVVSQYGVFRQGVCVWENEDKTGDQDCFGFGEIDKNVIFLPDYSMNDKITKVFVTQGKSAKIWEHSKGVGNQACIYGGDRGAELDLMKTVIKKTATTIVLSEGNIC